MQLFLLINYSCIAFEYFIIYAKWNCRIMLNILNPMRIFEPLRYYIISFIMLYEPYLYYVLFARLPSMGG